MSGVDLAVGTTAFVDLTFVGLEALPRPGQERYARDLLRSPGGGAITAVGAARLGLTVALATPLGRDADGVELRRVLEGEGVRCTGGTVERSPVAVVMPVDGDRAFVTYDPRPELDPGVLAALSPRAVVLDLDRLGAAPRGARVYATTGDEGADAYAGRPPAELDAARAIIVNESEALRLSGAADVEAAARALAQRATMAVVTLGRRGALACGGGELWRAEAPVVEAVDATGAGDLFTAAYAWADLDGAAPADRLAWATHYAAMSIGVPTAIAGAGTLADLVSAKERA